MKEYSGVSKWYIILCVLFVITGIVMLIWPHLTLDLLGLVLGVGMLVVGIAHIIIYFTKDNLGSVLQPDLTVGVILASFGAFMLMHLDVVGMILPFGAGILLLIGGITKIQYAIDMKRLYFSKWMVLLAFAIILILLGITLLYNPFKEQALIYFIGACLILDGALSIVSLLMITHRKKQFDKGKVPGKVLARINGVTKGEVVKGEVVDEEPVQDQPSSDMYPPAARHSFLHHRNNIVDAEKDTRSGKEHYSSTDIHSGKNNHSNTDNRTDTNNYSGADTHSDSNTNAGNDASDWVNNASKDINLEWSQNTNETVEPDLELKPDAGTPENPFDV